jgi:CheY-like chemotaxis protein
MPTVLVVEDDPLVLEMAAEALEDAGFAAIAVTAAEDALGLAVMDVAFDALFTDINLAGPMDGWELAEALREMRPDLPVVYASGSDPSEGGAHQVSGSIFVSKPYRPFDICRLMEGLAGIPQRSAERPARPVEVEAPQPVPLRLIA